jgi:hypothetical protein
MSEPAKDETKLRDCMAKAMHDSVYNGQSAWMDVSKIEQSYREMEADAALAAIRAAGWAVVPVEATDEMLWAGENLPAPLWEMENSDHSQFVLSLRRAEWAAMLAAAPGGEAMSKPAKDGNLEVWKEVCYAHEAELQWLRADNARLRAALEDLLDDTRIQDFGEWFEDRLKQARAALEAPP